MNWILKKESPGSYSVASLAIQREIYLCNIVFLFRLNTEVLVEFGDGSAISIRKILHQLAFLQQEDARGDVGNEVEVMAGDDDRSALLLADALNHVGDSHLGRWVEIVERLI